ncbi:MAG: flagellar biosynthetic protein FliO [Armatimonadetes bacterium]|nr:flagellar biosynthetic protein FliO [Armatimonadota bacterium]
MRLKTSLLLLVPPASAFADGILGTKSSSALGPVTAAAAGGGSFPILQMVMALLAVYVLLKWIMPKLANKVTRRLNVNLNSTIKVEESASFAGGNLFVVSARGKDLLLCVSASGVQCLADVTPTKEPEPLPPTFKEVLVEASPIRLVEAIEEREATQPEPEVQMALERLSRFTI